MLKFEVRSRVGDRVVSTVFKSSDVQSATLLAKRLFGPDFVSIAEVASSGLGSHDKAAA